MLTVSPRLRLGLAGLLLAAGILAGCASSDGDSPASGSLNGDAVAGQADFAGTCVSCHGPDAKGLPGLGKDLTTSTFIAEKSDAELVDFLKVGRPGSDPLNTTGVDMPPRGGNPALSDQDLADIVAFLRTIHTP